MATPSEPPSAEAIPAETSQTESIPIVGSPSKIKFSLPGNPGPKISAWFNGLTVIAGKLFRNANGPAQPTSAEIPRHEIHDVLDPNGDHPPRFEYDPDTLSKRLVVGIGAKTKLATSQLIGLEYRSWIRWLLVGLLAVVTVFLTPQLLPKWLGFKWSTPSDLCQSRDQKLERLRLKMEAIAKIPDGREFVSFIEEALKCMIRSARNSWSGRGSIRYPEQCIPKNARPDTKTRTECIPGKCARKCTFGIGLVCAKVCTPQVCKTFTMADPDSQKKIAELNARRQYQDGDPNANAAEAKATTQTVAETADKKAEQIVNRLLIQIDLASNLYIFYTMLAIIVGTPVVIYKREKGSRVLGATFGLRKSNFILLVLIILTVYDSGVKVFRDIDFPRLFRNFQNDPCYLDPKFSQARLQLIKDTCGNVTAHRQRLETAYAGMTRVYYDADLCQVCVANGVGPKKNPNLVASMDRERKRFSAGAPSKYNYPGSCNATELTHSTATAPESGVSFARAFLGSGILAQILLKAILSSWLVHLVSYFEPLTMHRGIVEIFGIPEGSPATLTKKETASVTRFARDKHLAPLIFTSMLMVWEFCIVIYSIVESYRSRNILQVVKADPVPTAKKIVYTCSLALGLLSRR